MAILNRKTVGMKQIRYLLLIFMMVSCSQYAEEPKNLLSQEKMAQILADIAISDEAFRVNSDANIETGTRQVMHQHKVTATDFSESYKYYSITKEIEGILEDAQKIVRKKHPEAAKFIKQQQEKSAETSPFVK